MHTTTSLSRQTASHLYTIICLYNEYIYILLFKEENLFHPKKLVQKFTRNSLKHSSEARDSLNKEKNTNMNKIPPLPNKEKKGFTVKDSDKLSFPIFDFLKKYWKRADPYLRA